MKKALQGLQSTLGQCFLSTSCYTNNSSGDCSRNKWNIEENCIITQAPETKTASETYKQTKLEQIHHKSVNVNYNEQRINK